MAISGEERRGGELGVCAGVPGRDVCFMAERSGGMGMYCGCSRSGRVVIAAVIVEGVAVVCLSWEGIDLRKRHDELVDRTEVSMAARGLTEEVYRVVSSVLLCIAFCTRHALVHSSDRVRAWIGQNP